MTPLKGVYHAAPSTGLGVTVEITRLARHPLVRVTPAPPADVARCTTYPRHVWDDDPPPARRDASGDQDADGGGNLWEPGEDDAGRERTRSAGPQTPRGKAVMLVVVTVVFLATIMLCCVAISQIAQLYGVDPAHR